MISKRKRYYSFLPPQQNNENKPALNPHLNFTHLQYKDLQGLIVPSTNLSFFTQK